MFLCEDIEFSSKLDFCGMSMASDYFLEIQYLDKRAFFLAETFRTFKGSLHLSMGKIVARKFSKTVITRFQRPIDTNPFRLLLVSSRSPCELNMSSNSGYQLE
jgi:hypothetical protein